VQSDAWRPPAEPDRPERHRGLAERGPAAQAGDHPRAVLARARKVDGERTLQALVAPAPGLGVEAGDLAEGQAAAHAVRQAQRALARRQGLGRGRGDLDRIELPPAEVGGRYPIVI
jgi:hypothetical protein